MKVFLSILCLLLLPSVLLASEPDLIPVIDKTVTVQYVTYKTSAEVTLACAIPNIPEEDDMPATLTFEAVLGCAQRFNDGSIKVITLDPKTWWDITALETLGHETLHALGFSHSLDYIPYYIEDPVIPAHIDAGIYARGEQDQ